MDLLNEPSRSQVPAMASDMHHLNNAKDMSFVARSSELQILTSSFQRMVATKSTEIVSISGMSGIGKSRLVKAFRNRHIEDKDAFYCGGKCEEARKNEPFAVLKDAMAELFSSLLPNEDKATEDLATRIRISLGREATVLTSVIPDLSTIIGNSPEEKATSTERLLMATIEKASDQLRHLLLLLVRCITATKPLVLFCDDLQWIDTSSLEVLLWLATDRILNSFMLVGAYRQNEIGHLWLGTIGLIEEDTPCNVHHIDLMNLNVDELALFIGSVLSLEANDTIELAKVAHEKTLGNPFFTLQFLEALEKRTMLFFSYNSNKWEWIDPQRIQSDTTIASDVVDLIAQNIESLPPDVQSCLKIASCLSSTILVPLLANLMEGTWSDEEIKSKLEIAEKSGLVRRLESTKEEEEVEYRFVHDRIQQSAYSLIPEGRVRDFLHFRIGHQLLEFSSRDTEGKDDWMEFVAADQLYRGKSCITREADCVGLGRVSLMAGRKAMEQAAFGPALRFLSSGVDSMGHVPRAWEDHHDLMLSLYQALADVSWCTGAPLESERAVNEVMLHAQTAQERIKASFTLAQVLGSQQRHKKAIAVEVQELQALDVFPRTFRTIKGLSLSLQLKSRLGRLSVDDIVSLPDCTDDRIIAAMNMLILLTKHATFDRNDVLQMLSVAVCCDLTLRYGVHESGISCFAVIGSWVSAEFGDAKEGFRLATMSLRLMERLDINDTLTMVVLYYYVFPWSIPLADTLEPLMATFDAGMKQGNVEMALVAFNVTLTHSFFAGVLLGSRYEDAQYHLGTVQNHGIESLVPVLRGYLQTVENLTEKVADPSILTGTWLDEKKFLRKPGNAVSLEQFYVWKVPVCCYFGFWDIAESGCREMWRLRKGAISFVEVSTRLYFTALTHIAKAASSRSLLHKRKARRSINAVRKAVIKEHKAVNLMHKLHLLDAEFLTLKAGVNKEIVREAYDRAITVSVRAGIRQDAALANLRAGLYFKGKDDCWASHYLTRSLELFRDWGADGLAEHWENMFSGLLDESSQYGLPSTDEGQLDDVGSEHQLES